MRLACWLLLALPFICLPTAPAADRLAVMSPVEFKERLVGPIVVVATPFKADASIDHDGVRKMVSGALSHEATVFALTAGDSLYSELSIDEVKSLTKTLAEAVADAGVVIAASGEWPKEAVLDYAKFAEKIGADAVQVLKPTDMPDDGVVAYYRDVASATRLGIVLHGNFSPELLDKIVSIDAVVALKEDVSLEYLMDRQLAFGERLNIFPGGAESRFLIGWPLGAKAYYSGFYQFHPALGKQFWDAMKKGDVRAGTEFVRNYDVPYMKMWSHPFWRATMAHFDVSERYMRPLANSYTDEQMKQVAKFWEELGIVSSEQVDRAATLE